MTRERNRQLSHRLGEGDAFRRVVDAFPDIVLTFDPDGTITYVNRSEHMPREDAIGRSAFDMINPDHIEYLRDAITRARASGEAVEYETEFIPPSGERFWYRTQISYVDDGDDGFFLNTTRDVSERRRMEARARDFMEVIDSTHSLVITTGPGLVTRYVNRAAVELMWGEGEHREGAGFRQLLSPEAVKRFEQEALPVLLEGRSWQGPLSVLRRDGSLARVDWTLSAQLKPDNTLLTLRGIGHDVSERDRMQAELMHAHKLEAVGQLAAGVAHEINTPMQYIGDNTSFLEQAFEQLLSVVGSMRELAASDEPAQSRRVALAQLERRNKLEFLCTEIPEAIQASSSGVETVRRLVRALKAFVHPGGHEAQPEDINELVRNVAIVGRNEYKYVAELELDLDPTLPLLTCNANELKQVFLNLLLNAAHAVGDVSSDESEKGLIRIATSYDDASVTVRVSDTGCGIPESVRHRVFEPFFTTKEVGRGTGQGLALSNTFVRDRHGGSLAFESEVGKGTTFIVRLPRALARAPRSATPAQAAV